MHIVVNNQVGFTTAPDSSRSSVYSTDVARTIQAPIFHVNGDDPEAVARIGRLAFAYRQEFRKDVVIDMVCYRRRGHNEADNPSFTQRAHVRPDRQEAVDAEDLHRVADRARRYHYGRGGAGTARLPAGTGARLHRDPRCRRAPRQRPARWSGPPPGRSSRPAGETVPTAITQEVVKQIIDTQLNLPTDFTVHPRLQPQLQRRAVMADEMMRAGPSASCWPSGPCSSTGTRSGSSARTRAGARSASGTRCWSTGTAAGSTRRCGPSTRRRPGSTPMTPCCRSSRRWASSTAIRWPSPMRWSAREAQYGDFANGAQTITDEFISSGEQKWGQRSGVVLLLPHGYEGQGPDHSSARPERFLSLCAQDNMTVAMPSTPASYFHLLRWQALSERVKPLMVFSAQVDAAAEGRRLGGGGFHQRDVPPRDQ